MFHVPKITKEESERVYYILGQRKKRAEEMREFEKDSKRQSIVLTIFLCFLGFLTIMAEVIALNLNIK